MHDDDIRAEFADLPDVLTVRQLAGKLGKSEKTIYAKLHDKSIPALQLEDDSWLIYRNSIVNWLIELNHRDDPGTTTT